MGGRSNIQMVPALIIAVLGVSASVCYAQQSSADCGKQCAAGCNTNPQVAAACAINCAIKCHWPFSQQTNEVLMTQGDGNNGADAPSIQAVLASHPNLGAGEPGAAAPIAGDQPPLNIPQNITQMSTV